MAQGNATPAAVLAREVTFAAATPEPSDTTTSSANPHWPAQEPAENPPPPPGHPTTRAASWQPRPMSRADKQRAAPKAEAGSAKCIEDHLIYDSILSTH